MNNNLNLELEYRKKRKIVYIIIAIILFLIAIISYYAFNYKYKYKIIYSNETSLIDGTSLVETYELQFNDNYDIKVSYKPTCSSKPCLKGGLEVKSKSYKVGFSDSNKELLKEFLNYTFKNNNGNIINKEFELFSVYERDVLNSITSNSEKEFELYAEPYDYRLIFLEDWNNKYEYHVDFKDNNIKVNKISYKDFKIDTVDSYNVYFSETNKNKVNNTINNLFKSKTKVLLFPKDLESVSENDLSVIKSIINNNENLLNK